MVLLAIGDHRLFGQAEKAINILTGFNDGHINLFRGRPVSIEEPFPPDEPLESAVNELLAMVAPKQGEENKRFRSLESAQEIMREGIPASAESK